MGGPLQVPEVDLLIPEIDLDQRIIYFPIRHHSPACSWHLSRLIREIRPDAVLIEGPRDATPVIPFLTDAQTVLPVAIFTTYVRRHKEDLAERFAAYYPLCDYSPELAAIRGAKEVGCSARFIDLTFPEQVNVRKGVADGKALSLLDEQYLRHSRFLQVACQRAGARDSNDLWDHLYESGYEEYDTAEFMRNVLAYCALARADYTPEMLSMEGSDARERAMAAAISEEAGRVIVVTGGFHTVALPTTKPAAPKKVQIAPEDAQVVLTRYSFEQLDALNGYASGMPSPEFYQRLWEGQDVTRILVELSSILRERGAEASTDDAITASSHVKRLGVLRGHATPTREDLLDGVRSVFVKGAVDIEGVLVLSVVRKLLAGDRIGHVPSSAGQPPIVDDFRRHAARLKVDLDSVDVKEVALDLYRKVAHREISRFFHRLLFLDVPFAELRGGPDFVTGANLDRLQEVWQYRWSPSTESSLIERSMYGSTVEEAASSLLMRHFSDVEKEGQGRRADTAAALLLSACRMGLHKNTQDLVSRTGRLVAEDSSVVSLTRALTSLLLLHQSREPLEAHELSGVMELARTAFHRACFLLPNLASTPEAEESDTLNAMNALSAVPAQMENESEDKRMLCGRLKDLLDVADGNAAVRGAAAGLLYSDGELPAEKLVQHLRGHLLSPGNENNEGIDFLRGMLTAARSALWLVPEIIESISELLMDWDEESFIKRIPNLRLAFSGLTPRECDRVAQAVSGQLGMEPVRLTQLTEFSEADLLHSVALNKLVMDSLTGDGLADWILGKDAS